MIEAAGNGYAPKPAACFDHPNHQGDYYYFSISEIVKPPELYS